MALNRPTASELIDILREFLEKEVTPQVTPATQFHLRVAGNVLAMLDREITERPAADAAETARLEALLGRRGPLADLNAALVLAIRDGRFDAPDQRARLLAHLRATTAAKIAIDNPKYAAQP